MNVLEKILEEIDTEVQKQRELRKGLKDTPGYRLYEKTVVVFKSIVAKHMDKVDDDGWIPVSERLPNEREFQEAYCRNHCAAEFLVMIKGATRPTTLYFVNNSWFDEELNYYKVAAWQPLPEPYKGGE